VQLLLEEQRLAIGRQLPDRPPRLKQAIHFADSDAENPPAPSDELDGRRPEDTFHGGIFPMISWCAAISRPSSDRISLTTSADSASFSSISSGSSKARARRWRWVLGWLSDESASTVNPSKSHSSAK
jgi:hypothetical protein